MTDWVVAEKTRSPGKVEEDKWWEVATIRVGGRANWDQAKVKEGGGRKQGRERRLQKTKWAGMTR